MRDRESVSLEAMWRFVVSRNDNFNFRDGRYPAIWWCQVRFP